MMKVVYGEVPEREVTITTTEYGAKFLSAVLKWYCAVNPECQDACVRASRLLDPDESWFLDINRVDKLFR